MCAAGVLTRDKSTARKTYTEDPSIKRGSNSAKRELRIFDVTYLLEVLITYLADFLWIGISPVPSLSTGRRFCPCLVDICSAGRTQRNLRAPRLSHSALYHETDQGFVRRGWSGSPCAPNGISKSPAESRTLGRKTKQTKDTMVRESRRANTGVLHLQARALHGEGRGVGAASAGLGLRWHARVSPWGCWYRRLLRVGPMRCAGGRAYVCGTAALIQTANLRKARSSSLSFSLAYYSPTLQQ